MVKVGIIGAGNTIGISKNHVEAYKKCEDAVITAVYDILEGRAQVLIDNFELKNAVVCNSLEQLFSLCDAVSICTPNCTHVELTVAALKAGKHVLCEKPFAPSAAECREAIRYAKLSQKVAMIGLCYRDIPGLVYMKKILDEGKLGKIFYVREIQGGDRIANPNVKLEWRMQEDLSGPGSLADFGSHMMDICDYMLRDYCGKISQIQCMEHTCITEREVIGKPGKMGAVTNDDVACWICRTESGAIYNFTSTRIGGAFMLEVVGEGGRLVFDGSHKFQLSAQLKDKNDGFRSAPEILRAPADCFGPTGEPVGKDEFEHNFYYEIRQFLDAIQSGKESLLTLERGRYVQQLIEAAHTAAKTGQMVNVYDFE